VHEDNHSRKKILTFINMFKVFVAMEEEGKNNQEEKMYD
jgi:hypothetical protein